MGLGIGLSLSVCFIGLAWFLLKNKKASRDDKEFIFYLKMHDEFGKGTGPIKFPYNKLVSANKFAEAEKVGQGG